MKGSMPVVKVGCQASDKVYQNMKVGSFLKNKNHQFLFYTPGKTFFYNYFKKKFYNNLPCVNLV